MPECGHVKVFFLVAIGANSAFSTLFGAGGLDGEFPIAKAVTGRGNNDIFLKDNVLAFFFGEIQIVVDVEPILDIAVNRASGSYRFDLHGIGVHRRIIIGYRRDRNSMIARPYSDRFQVDILDVDGLTIVGYRDITSLDTKVGSIFRIPADRQNDSFDIGSVFPTNRETIIATQVCFRHRGRCYSRRNVSSHHFAANGAGMTFLAFLRCAGYPFAPSVTCRGNLFDLEFNAAFGAVIMSFAFLYAGRLQDILPFAGVVSERRDHFDVEFGAADGAKEMLAALLEAGRLDGNDPLFSRRMRQSCDRCFGRIAATRTDLASRCQTDGGASGCSRTALDHIVTECGDLFHFEFFVAYSAD